MFRLASWWLWEIRVSIGIYAAGLLIASLTYLMTASGPAPCPYSPGDCAGAQLSGRVPATLISRFPRHTPRLVTSSSAAGRSSGRQNPAPAR